MANERYVVAIGADNAGADMKNALKKQLEADPRVDVIDLGVPDASDDRAYPHVGIDVAQAVARGDARRGLLVCGTGIGMAISANKVPGVRATVAHDSYSVERSVLSNDCQVLTLGARVIGLELAKRLVDEWLDYEFDPSSPSAAKVAVIAEFEERGSGEGDDSEQLMSARTCRPAPASRMHYPSRSQLPRVLGNRRLQCGLRRHESANLDQVLYVAHCLVRVLPKPHSTTRIVDRWAGRFSLAPHSAEECDRSRALQDNLERAWCQCAPRSAPRIVSRQSAASSPRRSCAGKVLAESSPGPHISAFLPF